MMLLIVIAARGRRSMLLFVGIGLVIGLAQYMYASARLLPIAGGILLAALLWRRKIGLTQVGLVALAAFVAVAPLGAWYLQNPGTISGRMNDVFILNASALTHTLGADYAMPRDLGRLASLQISRIGGYLVNAGDTSTKYAREFPGFDVITVGLFWFGLAQTLFRARRVGEFASLTWFLAGFTTAGLLTIDAPSANRLLVAIPSVYLLAGYGAQRLAALTAGLAGRIRAGARPAASTRIAARCTRGCGEVRRRVDSRWTSSRRWHRCRARSSSRGRIHSNARRARCGRDSSRSPICSLPRRRAWRRWTSWNG